MITQLLLLTFVACRPEIKEPAVVLEEVAKREATNLQTLSTNDPALGLSARVVDQYGFSIPDQAVEFVRNGETTALVTDSFGYASIKSDSLEASVSATVNWNDQSDIATYATAPNPLELTGYVARYFPTESESSHIATLSNGLLVAFGSELWFAGADTNSLPHQVANLPLPVLGIWAKHIDNDGILDAVAWTENAVYALRGRPAGGIGLGNEWSIREKYEGQIVGVSVEQLDDDNHADIAIGMTTKDLGYITLLRGDGSWNFSQQPTLETLFPISTMVAADENQDGFADVSVINSAEGTLHRYSYTPKGWSGAFPSLIDPSDFTALPGAELPPASDLNGDGRKDLLIFDGEGSTQQDLVFFLLTSGFMKYDQNLSYYDATVVDLDQNGTDEILALTDTFLHLTYYNENIQDFSVRSVNVPSAPGPIAPILQNDDDLMDITVLLEQPFLLEGKLQGGTDWALTQTFWKEDGNSAVVSEHIVVQDFDQNGSVEIAAMVTENEQSKLRIFRYGQDFTDLQLIDTASLSNTDVLDFKYCDGQLISIVDNGTDHILRSHEFTNNSLSLVFNTVIDQTKIDCALIDGELQFLAYGGSDNYIVYSQSFVQIDSGTAGNWNDAAIGAGSNGSLQTVLGCTDTDCQVELADLDGDGTEETIFNNSSGISIQGLQETAIVLTQTGDIHTADIDNDGAEELLIREADSNWVWIVQATEGQLSAISGSWIDSSFIGFPQFFNIEADARLEQVVVSPSGGIVTSHYTSSN